MGKKNKIIRETEHLLKNKTQNNQPRDSGFLNTNDMLGNTSSLVAQGQKALMLSSSVFQAWP
jgi:hypothetical protein